MTELSGNAVFLGPDEHRAAAAGDDAAARGRGSARARRGGAAR